MTRIRLQLALTLLLGALTVLGFAPFYLFPIPLITLTVLCHLWRGSATSFHSALLGFSFGMGMFSAGVTWIYVSLHVDLLTVYDRWPKPVRLVLQSR